MWKKSLNFGYIGMKIIESEYVKGLKHHLYYKCDLEKLPTEELIWMLRGCRKTISRETYSYNKEWADKYMENIEGKWIEFSWDEWNCYHTMIWMLKDVLSRRGHVYKSKADRKYVRQMQAKYHTRDINKIKKAM